MSESSTERQSDHPEHHCVAIIGGGLAGLATAAHLHLADPTLDLTLFEAADQVGGVIQTDREADFLIDHGADMFALKPPAAFDLCKQLGVTDQLIEPKQEGRGAMIVCRGRLVPIPDGFVLMRATKLWPMLKTPLLSVSGKLGLIAERFKPNNVTDTDQSVAQFVRTRMGEEVLQRIVGPLVAGIYTANIEKLSLLSTMGPIAKMVRTHGSLHHATKARRKSGEDSTERNSAGARYSQFRAFKNGMAGLIDALAGSLPAGVIHTSSPVAQITQQASTSRWSVQVGDDIHQFDHVVVATPVAVTANLISQAAPVAAQQFAAIESASTAIVVLGVRKSDVAAAVSTFGFVVPQGEGRRILAGSFASNKFAGRAPDDQLLIRVFIGGAMQSDLLANDDDALIQMAREELADLIGLSGDPIVSKVIRWNKAMPQYHVGHRQRVEEIEQDLANVTGLSVIGNAMHGVGISPLIGEGKKTSQKVRQALAEK